MGFGPAITTSKSAGFHHLITDSRPWYKNPRQFPLSVLSESQTHLKDRYSQTEFLHRAFVRHFTTLKSHRPGLITPCRLITSSTNGYDGMSFRIYIARISYFLTNSAGSMMSTYLMKFEITEPQSLFYRRSAIHSSVGVCFQLSKWWKSTWFNTRHF